MPKAAQNFPTLHTLGDDKGEDLGICQCAACGLVQLDNEPVSYYKEVIRAAAFSEEMRGFRIDQFKKFVDKYSLRNKKVVEIGCGKGEFLTLMKKAGADTYGIEYSDESVEYCRENDLKVSKLYIENNNDLLPAAPYDCFFIMNFFEHLPDPNSTLRALHKNLSDDGVGLIEVPNFDMILKNNLFSEFINDHLFYFTKETLRLTLERNGFEIVECNEIWYDYIISAVVRKRPKTNLSDFQSHQEKIKKEIGNYIAGFSKDSVVIWGAGHQSLVIMSMAELNGKIKYVVDSATFKQGKYTPATHIPIVGPERLNSDPVEAIIVMAASYSDEVAGIIQKKYNNNIKVAILRDFGLELID